MAATPEITRLVLRKLAGDAVAASATLTSVLNAAAFGTVSQTLSGKVVIEAQGAGTITRYELPTGRSALIPQEVSAMLSRLLDLYDRAVTPTSTMLQNGWGGGLTGGVGANDAAILQWMLAQLAPIYAYSPDFSAPALR